jgi:hypothetical protein
MLRKIVAGLVVGLLAIGIVSAMTLATLEGTIKKIDGSKLTVTDKNMKDTVVTVDKDAKITLDDKAAKLADLKVDQHVKVTHEDLKASAVDAHSPKK